MYFRGWRRARPRSCEPVGESAWVATARWMGSGTHWELRALASGGLKPLEVIRIGTIFGAEAIGFGKDLGSLEPGKLADLIVLDKNPLEDIRNTEAIRMVMKNGRLYQGDDLQEIWPRKRSLPPFWWATEVPGGKADWQPGGG